LRSEFIGFKLQPKYCSTLDSNAMGVGINVK